jgi:hypothetical protein
VAAILDLSYRELPGQAARSYRLLGLHPGPDFGHEVAAAAVGVGEKEAEDLLDVLVDASLLIDVGEDRYRFHDLLRLHARHWADAQDEAGERDRAVRRMLEWYLRATITADRTVIPLAWRLGPEYEKTADTPRADRSSTQALDWMESALPNLMAALRTATSHGWDELARLFLRSIPAGGSAAGRALDPLRPGADVDRAGLVGVAALVLEVLRPQ